MDTQTHAKYERLIERTRALQPTPTVVVHPCDETSLMGAVEAAGLSADEALKTFNMGLGFALILDAAEAPKAAALLREAGETVYEIGEIVAGEGRVVYR